MKIVKKYHLTGLLLICILFLQVQYSYAQSVSQVYNWNWKTDGVTLGVGAGLLGTGMMMRNNAEVLLESEINTLSGDNIWFLDKTAVDNFSYSSDHLSDIFLFGSYVFPLTHFISSDPQKNRSVLFGMFMESSMISAGLTNIIKASIQRNRPYTYNSSLPLDERLSSTGHFSFPSGHTSVVTNLCFFTAKVHSDLHPDSKWNKWIWAGAITVPAYVGYLRYRAGKHFPTDVIGGYAIGALVGYLIPELHRNKPQSSGRSFSRSGDLSLQVGMGGARLSYTF